MNKIHFGLKIFFSLSILSSVQHLCAADAQNVEANIHAFEEDQNSLSKQIENIPFIGLFYKSNIVQKAIIPGAACGGLASGACVAFSATPIAVPMGVVTACAAGYYNYSSCGTNNKLARVFRAFGIKIDQVQAGQEAIQKDITAIKTDVKETRDGVNAANQKLDATVAGVARLEAGQEKIQQNMRKGFANTAKKLSNVETTVRDTQVTVTKAINQHGAVVGKMADDVAQIKALLQLQASSKPEITYLQPPKSKGGMKFCGGVPMLEKQRLSQLRLPFKPNGYDEQSAF